MIFHTSSKPVLHVVQGAWAHPSDDGYQVALQADLSKHCSVYTQSFRKRQLLRVNFHTVHSAL